MSGSFRSADKKASNPRIIICIPIFNDWESALMLIDRIDTVAQTFGETVSIVLIDDGSTEAIPNLIPSRPKIIECIDMIHLRRNVGHQRAIALGLTYIYTNCPCQAVVVMDGDGEDAPEDIKTLIDQCRSNDFRKIVFAKRSKRTEGVFFKIGYHGFKVLHYLLTGIKVEVGNFSVIPFELLKRLVGVSELWNHYAASVFQARLPIDKVPIDRAHRLVGESKMNFISLVMHGLSAISVFSIIVGIRLLCLVSFLILLTFLGILTAFYVRLFTELAIPGWATNLTGILFLVFLNLLLLIIVFVMFMLQSRSKSNFIPIRDWKYFVSDHRSLYG